MGKSWKAECPSNIALIKYMGKKDVEKNIPTNASISWTLDHLKTSVILQETNQSQDSWSALPSDFPFEMSSKGKEKYLGHLKRLKEYFGVAQNFEIQSANNFPADCGIASSASSFAALTEVCVKAFSELSGKEISLAEKAHLSARGSGSSCRSFMSGLVHWDQEGVHSVSSDMEKLHHMVVLAGDGAKKVSSSEAHKQVKTSALFQDRVSRTEERLEELQALIAPLNWKKLYEIVWAEFWDMHALFETSHPSFGYFLPDTIEILNSARDFWEMTGDGPLVTMDAGPNVHLLWRHEQQAQAVDFFQQAITKRWSCLSNIQEIGFAQI